MAETRFDDLLQMFLDDSITDQQVDELKALAASDPDLLAKLRQELLMSDWLSQYEDPQRSEARFIDSVGTRIAAAEDSNGFVDRVIESVRLGDSKKSSTPVEATAKTKNANWQTRVGKFGWIAAAIVVLFVFVQAFQSAPVTAPSVGREHSKISDTGVAVLTRVSHLKGEQTDNWRVGQTIPPGVLKWDTGLVQLEFYSGATVVIEGPAEIEVVNESSVVCRSGRLRANVPEPARGFEVLGPNFELVDLGTEFGLSVSNEGVSEVHVFDGKVELYDKESNRDLATRRELNAGDALTLDNNGVSKVIDSRSADFVSPTRLSEISDARRQGHRLGWQQFSDSLKDDARVIAYFPFDKNDGLDRRLVGYGANGEKIEGAIVGCEWSEGRWPNKSSLQFKRPGDRVRVNIPSEFDSLTFSAWLRLDGLDRQYSSLFTTDLFDKRGIHWQIHQNGELAVSVKRAIKDSLSFSTEPIFSPFRLGQWVNLVTVYDSGESRVSHYVNGERVFQEAISWEEFKKQKIGAVTIGNWSRRKDALFFNDAQRERKIRNLNGRIDELIVFGQALTDSEVLDIYEVGRP